MREGQGTIKVRHTSRGKKYFLGGQYYGIYLTEREFDILRLVRRYKYYEIAKMLGISRRTVESYTAKVKTKFNCENKAQMVNVLMQSGLLFEIEQYQKLKAII